jgi:hypothetical protein
MGTRPVGWLAGLMLAGALLPGCEWCGRCKGLCGKPSGPTYASGVQSTPTSQGWNNANARAPSAMGTSTSGRTTNTFTTPAGSYTSTPSGSDGRSTQPPATSEFGAKPSTSFPVDSGVKQTTTPASYSPQPVVPASGTRTAAPPAPEEPADPDVAPNSGPVLTSPPSAPPYRPE